MASLSAFGEDAAPPKPWSTSAGAGLALTSGNTDTKNFNVAFSTKYDPKTRIIFKSDALYIRGGATMAVHTELKFGYTYDYKTKPIPSTLKKGDSALFAAILFKY